MKIAIDYDKNYEVRPRFFDRIAFRFQKAGHQVGVVTARHEEEGCPVDFKPDFVEFLDIGELNYTDRATIKTEMMGKLGIDILLDDRADLFPKDVVVLNLT
jgi:hypothetical protein